MKFYNHPAYIGYAKDAKGKKKFKKQFNKRGFDDTVTWSLDTAIAEYIYPRLKKYYKLADKQIDIDYHKGFRKAIEDMLIGFKLLSEDVVHTEEDYKKINKAFKQLSKYHSALWI